MYVCMYVCICAYVWAYAQVYFFLYVYAYIYMNVHITTGEVKNSTDRKVTWSKAKQNICMNFSHRIIRNFFPPGSGLNKILQSFSYWIIHGVVFIESFITILKDNKLRYNRKPEIKLTCLLSKRQYSKRWKVCLKTGKALNLQSPCAFYFCGHAFYI